MRTACIYHDTFVNKIMRDLVELEMACNVKFKVKEIWRQKWLTRPSATREIPSNRRAHFHQAKSTRRTCLDVAHAREVADA